MFLSDVLLIFLSHTYHVLVCCFLLLLFQSHFLAFLFLLFRYMLGFIGEYNVWTHRELPSSRLPVDWFCWSCLRFIVLFFPKCSKVFVISLITIYTYLWVFVSFVSNVGVLAFSGTVGDKSKLSSMFLTLKNSIVSCITI